MHGLAETCMYVEYFLHRSHTGVYEHEDDVNYPSDASSGMVMYVYNDCMCTHSIARVCVCVCVCVCVFVCIQIASSA